MANRGSSTAFQTEIVKSQSQPIHLIDVVFDDTTHRLTDAFIPITFDGNAYSALGYLLNFSVIEETSEILANRLSIQLSGVGSQFVSEVLTPDYIDRQVIIRKGFLNSSNALIADPIIIFDGRMDNPSISENGSDGSATVTLTASNQFINFTMINGRYTNNSSQQLFYENDNFFSFASEINKDIQWGGSSQQVAQSLDGVTGTNASSHITTKEVAEWHPTRSNLSGGILSFVSGENFIYVNEAEHGRITGQIVTIRDATGGTDVNAATINGGHSITVVNDYQWKTSVTTSVSTTENFIGGASTLIGNQIVFTAGILTTNNSNVIQILAFQNQAIVGEQITLESCGAVGGITEAQLTSTRFNIKNVYDNYIEVPITQSTNANSPPLQTNTSNNNRVTVLEANHQRATGDTVVFSGASAIGGVAAGSINVSETITAIVDENSWYFEVSGTPVSSSVNRGGGNVVLLGGESIITPPIATTSGSPIVTLYKSAHGLSVNDEFIIHGCASVGSIPELELNKTHTVASVPDSDSITFTVTTLASATAIGGGRNTNLTVPVKASSTARGGSKFTILNLGIQDS